ncbi:MAG: metal-sensitive transcriptional regulator [Euryhalocaulis sp.]|uniref:metal-sensitive transcriptional regulator n=1 Tax=Euryhalocaulis sp. TaxID=2744307 RepID=UPI0018099A36|nr:metal-sensitive transcriptional regulator [Euryhalocaulis sp.]MBA4801071.1 metal-sensitive transcriptional regulator [Euryhalocaulis sp.]
MTDHSALKPRLARIEGQVRGVAKMIEEGRYCIDIVTQIQAIRAGLSRVEDVVLQDHVAHCVQEAIESGDLAQRQAKIDELMRVLPKSRRE